MSEVGGPIGGGANVIPAAPAGPQRPKAGPRGVDAVRDILANARSEQPAGEGEEPAQPQGGEPMPGAGAPEMGISQPDPEAAGAAGDGEKLSLNDLAEKAGVSVEDLYNAELALPDDRGTITLEALKTGHTEAQRLKEKSQDLEQRTRDFENQQIQTRQELTELLKQIPREALSPELLQQVQEQHARTLEENRAALLQVKPDWEDPQVFQAAREQILGAVSDYGFTRVDLDSVVDYRLTKLLHDFAELRKHVADAQAMHKQVRSQGAPKPTSNGAAATAAPALSDELRNKAQSGDRMAQLSAVNAILRQR